MDENEVKLRERLTAVEKSLKLLHRRYEIIFGITWALLGYTLVTFITRLIESLTR